MPFDQEAKDRLLKFINGRVPRLKPCSLCGNGQWTLGDRIWELREFSGGSMLLGGQVFPIVPIVCTNCGNTLFINAVIAGMVEPAKDEEAVQADNKEEAAQPEKQEEASHGTN